MIQNDILLHTCLPYKFWKKYIKKHKDHLSPEEIIPLLEEQCTQVENVFLRELACLLQPRTRCFSSWCHREPFQEGTIEERKKELLLYSELNNQALFKICKKLQKNGAKDLMSYFTKRKASHIYHFLSGSQKVYLQMLSHPEKECPICLETANTTTVILNCGHTLCFSCFEEMSGIGKIRGTLYNRIAIVNKKYVCPMCRWKKPLTNPQAWNFFPSLALHKMN